MLDLATVTCEQFAACLGQDFEIVFPDGTVIQVEIAADDATPSAIKPRVDHEAGWWPTQAMPKALVRTPNRNDFPAPHASCEMMVQFTSRRCSISLIAFWKRMIFK